MQNKSKRFRNGDYQSSKRFFGENDWKEYGDVASGDGVWRKNICRRFSPITTTKQAAMLDLIQSVEHVKSAGLDGDFVECGVYMGGSSAIMMYTAKQLGISPTMWMYDTYSGVPEPDESETFYDGRSVKKWYNENDEPWCYSSLEDVKLNIEEFVEGYPGEIKYVQGMVEDTIPQNIPDQISILRIDVDLVNPTRHVLDNLYERVVPGGHIILDDYGHFPEVKKTVDEFFDNKKYIFRVDKNCRHIIK